MNWNLKDLSAAEKEILAVLCNTNEGAAFLSDFFGLCETFSGSEIPESAISPMVEKGLLSLSPEGLLALTDGATVWLLSLPEGSLSE